MFIMNGNALTLSRLFYEMKRLFFVAIELKFGANNLLHLQFIKVNNKYIQ